MIEIKDTDVLRGMLERNYDPTLINIILAVAEEFGVVVTESYRHKRHRNDLHGTQPVRAMDIRSRCYDNPKMVEAWINNRWAYDTGRMGKKVAVLHDVGLGMHFHIQTHPRTIRRAL